MTKKIWALAGFLGHSTDWNFLKDKHLNYIDPFTLSFTDLVSFAKALNQKVKIENNSRNILLGYSLGGRMAIHALVESPEFWDAAVIISAHTGLKKESDRLDRIIRDREWAFRFRNQEWNSLMVDWDCQKIFENELLIPKRNENDYSREQLSYLMEKCSLGYQQDLKTKVEALPLPILWIVGERDQNYRQQAEMLSLINPHSRIVIIPEGGHRLLVSHPILLTEQINNWVAML